MYPIQTPAQLTAYLRSLRRSRHLTQAQLGEMLGVTAARVSEIERDPGQVAFSQLHRILQLLGARLVIEPHDAVIASLRPARPAGGEW